MHARDASAPDWSNSGGPQDPTNPGGTIHPWPPPARAYAHLRVESTIFETKFGQSKENQFDGQKGGEQWKSLVGNYLVARHPMMAHILRWAENRGSNPVTKSGVESVRLWMDEDPHVINHLLWGFMNINLVGAANEIFSNTEQSNGLEVWRRIHALICATTERRQEEHYRNIHNPNQACGQCL